MYIIHLTKFGSLISVSYRSWGETYISWDLKKCREKVGDFNEINGTVYIRNEFYTLQSVNYKLYDEGFYENNGNVLSESYLGVQGSICTNNNTNSYNFNIDLNEIPDASVIYITGRTQGNHDAGGTFSGSFWISNIELKDK